MEHTSPRAVLLFSGGLDSILAAKVLEEQGIAVDCVHFVTPFFGSRHRKREWKEEYGLDVSPVDIGDSFLTMLRQGPKHGFGKTLNPCIDCKILLLREAMRRMEETGASFIATGEVVGQRPMSQRRDALNLISREAQARDALLRPLCARCLPPTPMEERGLVKRELLYGISGRGRKAQYELAEHFGIRTIPAPGGGCLLTEKENARSYWPLLARRESPTPEDFALANIGRQFWLGDCWLCVGRNQHENEALLAAACDTDLVFKTACFPGPVALGRPGGCPWPEDVVRAAASFVASFSSKAAYAHARTGEPVGVRMSRGGKDIQAVFAEGGVSRDCRLIMVSPSKDAAAGGQLWEQPSYQLLRPLIRRHGEKGRPGSEDAQAAGLCSGL